MSNKKFVWKIYQDKKGIFWFGTEEGLYKFENELNEYIKIGNLDKAIQITESELKKCFEWIPQIINNTLFVLNNSSINFEFGKSKNKKTFTGSEKSDEILLRKICTENLNYRYPNSNDKIIERIDKEIKAITEQGFSSYFLIN